MGRGNQDRFQKVKENTTGGGNFALSKVCRDIQMGRAIQQTCREDV